MIFERRRGRCIFYLALNFDDVAFLNLVETIEVASFAVHAVSEIGARLWPGLALEG